MIRVVKKLLLFSYTLFFLSCEGDKSLTRSEPLAITNRSAKEATHKIVFIKMNSPALLESAMFLADRLIVSEDDKLAITREQKETEQFLKSLSSEVKIIYRYRFVLNAFSVYVPSSILAKIKAHTNVSVVQDSLPMIRPMAEASNVAGFQDMTSTKHIGALRVHQELFLQGENGEKVAITGKEIKVGIIDTGIDYTHKMFGGEGSEEVFKSLDPNIRPEKSFFPTSKVVGGIDLVGSDYNDASANLNRRIPQPDANPIDESGHGTHVAGTVAGRGDGINTYTGVAPDAKLYAIKVFGRSGSTSDAVVIAALEYAVDPNRDLNPDDRLDVLNLSLGSSFGLPYRLYDEAVSNLVKAHITPVMSAGNSGNVPFIVGAPGSTDKAISVAASIDSMEHNWKFRAVRFNNSSESILHRAIEASFTKQIKSAGPVSAKLIDIGFADTDLNESQNLSLKGHVAFIKRGKVAFIEKVARAYDAGAIGVVIANNNEDKPFRMGGDGYYDIPAIMITKDLGDKLETILSSKQDVTIDFLIDQKIERPEKIDTLAPFSSRGPRSIDALIKPEISAPGYKIISAKIGSGDKGLSLSGTSMAAPHMSGVVALLKQYRGSIDEEIIKDLLLSTSIPIDDENNIIYSVANQGAGRVDAYKALTTPFVVSPAALSLGTFDISEYKSIERVLKVTNLSKSYLSIDSKVLYDLGKNQHESYIPSIAALSPGESLSFPIKIKLESPSTKVSENFGFIDFTTNLDQSYSSRLSYLSLTKAVSNLVVNSLNIYAASEEDSSGSVVELNLENKGEHSGRALIYNLIGTDTRKAGVGEDSRYSDVCDLESFGYRVIETTGRPYLEFAAKLYSPLTSWHHCELSVQIDGNNDGTSDQELIGGQISSLIPNRSNHSLASILTDAQKMREIRKRNASKSRVNYSDAILGINSLVTTELGTLMIIKFPLKDLARSDFGQLRIKVAAIVATDPGLQQDDYLKTHEAKWYVFDPFKKASPYYGMPEKLELGAKEKIKIKLHRGEQKGDLVIYLPENRSSRVYQKDKQAIIPKASYGH